MNAVEQAVEQLAEISRWSYTPHGSSATEPAAWTALALAAHGESAAAGRPASWLAEVQQSNGSVGVTAQLQTPRWPTSLAILAWNAVDGNSNSSPRFQSAVHRAVQWAVNVRGNTGPRRPQVGHDTTIAGWSWAENTHSWLEPTCFFVQALRSSGMADHPRARDGVRMIVDRQLPVGGCNYGNTFALGQMLLPHVQSTGIALETLAPERADDPRIEKSVAYLQQAISPTTATASLCFALMGLAAFGRAPADAERWIEDRLLAISDDAAPAQKRALLLLAAARLTSHRPALEPSHA